MERNTLGYFSWNFALVNKEAWTKGFISKNWYAWNFNLIFEKGMGWIVTWWTWRFIYLKRLKARGKTSTCQLMRTRICMSNAKGNLTSLGETSFQRSQSQNLSSQDSSHIVKTYKVWNQGPEGRVKWGSLQPTQKLISNHTHTQEEGLSRQAALDNDVSLSLVLVMRLDMEMSISRERATSR